MEKGYGEEDSTLWITGFGKWGQWLACPKSCSEGSYHQFVLEIADSYTHRRSRTRDLRGPSAGYLELLSVYLRYYRQRSIYSTDIPRSEEDDSITLWTKVPAFEERALPDVQDLGRSHPRDIVHIRLKVSGASRSYSP